MERERQIPADGSGRVPVDLFDEKNAMVRASMAPAASNMLRNPIRSSEA
jgi:hypothetical protein